MRREVVAWCRMLRWCFLATLMLGAFFSGAAPSSSLRSLRRWLSRSTARLAPLSSSTTAVGDPSFASAGASVTVPSGLVAIFKPKNWTSSDVVMKVKGVLLRGMQQRCASKFKLKIGHGGTLDPLAEGVLVLGVGEGTKLMAQYLEGSKGYQAVACLGAETDTLDCTGEVIERVDCSAIDERALDAALAQFRGDIRQVYTLCVLMPWTVSCQPIRSILAAPYPPYSLLHTHFHHHNASTRQVPPMYSALKRDGKKLYELARAGIEVEREARNVSVYSLQLTAEVQEDAAGHVKRKLQLPLFGLDVSSRCVVRRVVRRVVLVVGT